ncbi:MAG: tRNA (adenosine(37)-N6)-threonylcarbamoyltransferase complex ATPase subunit type 1 TsaE [Melioribacteraceae bacterium]|nr:tRNA (adenosine(37)-N6)-threonylcarbamoyltransferase complex ATPase subunit type 1 TsaE [Melioribacteraceae bacterium]
MELPFKIVVKSEEETEQVAKQFADILEAGNIIALNGNLGSGKTFFVKAISNYWNYNDANSPTFSIVNEYLCDKKIYHFDFYRLNKIEELYDIGFEEYLMDDEAVTFIEWAEMIPEILPSTYYEIKIVRLNDSERSIEILLNRS